LNIICFNDALVQLTAGTGTARQYCHSQNHSPILVHKRNPKRIWRKQRVGEHSLVPWTIVSYDAALRTKPRQAE